MKIAVSAYSFYQAIRQNKMTLEDTVFKAKELGFEGIEFLDMPGDTLEQQKESARKFHDLAAEAGIEIAAYTIGANLFQGSKEKDEEEILRLCGQVDVAEILGTKTMRHDVVYRLGTSGNARSFGLMLPTIAKNVRKVTDYAATKGIRTCSENHGLIAQDSYRVEQLFNTVANDNYGLLVDIGNFVCADEDNLTAVSRVAPYAIHVHAKDMYKSTEQKPGWGVTRAGNAFLGAAVGEGDCNAQACIRAIRKSGYDGWFSIEFEGPEDCIEAIQRGYKNLKSWLDA